MLLPLLLLSQAVLGAGQQPEAPTQVNVTILATGATHEWSTWTLVPFVPNATLGGNMSAWIAFQATQSLGSPVNFSIVWNDYPEGLFVEAIGAPAAGPPSTVNPLFCSPAPQSRCWESYVW